MSWRRGDCADIFHLSFVFVNLSLILVSDNPGLLIEVVL